MTMPVDTHDDIVPATGVVNPNGVDTHEDIKPAMGLTAYHGSPHEFEQFDTSKIGTGEGAQAYGHGLYFAENEDVADQYRKNSEGKYAPNSIARRMLNGWKDRDLAIQKQAEYISKLEKSHNEDFIAPYRGALEILKSGKEPRVGHMYEVRLNAGPENLLDWDKPLSEQPAYQAVRKHWDDKVGDPDIILKRLDIGDDSTGRDLYEALGGGRRNPENASRALSEMGIRGIRYLDAGSRGKDGKTGSSNYVIFDPKHIQTVRRYAEGGGIKAYFMHAPREMGERLQRAFGGGITPIELNDNNLEDEARRLILWSYAAAPIVRPLSREDGGRTYPVSMPTEINEDLKAGKARMRKLSPQEFLNESDPLHIGKGDRHIINSFERHIKSGDPLGPLKLYEGGHQDGRHRANAAKELGISKVPVVDYRKADGGPVDDAQNAVDVAKNISPVENDLLQPIGKSKMVGDEKLLFDEGQYKAGVSSFPWNNKRSIRYLHHDDEGNPIGALQIMTQGPRTKKAVIQNVYVSENNRRNKIASGLLKRARQDYDVRHSNDLTTQGRAFAKAVKAAGGPVDDAQNAVDVARNLTPMGFYSAAAEAASKIPQRAPIDQIINKVKGSPNVKAEELDWSGVRDAFAGQKSVDPKAVAQHLQASLPQIKETVYRENDPESALARWGRGENIVTPGHANYREVLLHTPSTEPEPETEYLVTGAFPMRFDTKEQANDYIDKMIKLREEVPALANKIDQFPMNVVAQNKHIPSSEKDFHSGHWAGVPNVLAHLRMSDRGMYSFGYPEALHIEEMQSDWGQKGRDEGFQGDKGVEPDEGLPRGPHVTTTEGWTDLALKRALREAAQGKYKKLTWTPGEEQAERYGLDKKFNQLHYSPDTNHLVAKSHSGYDDIDERVSPDALPGFIGKDLAAKLLDRPVTINPHPDVQGDKVQSLIGGEIKVPQKGMRDFYDRMIPNRLQKIVSKLDPEAKVQLYGHKIFVPEEEGSEEGEYQKVHSLEITPKLRAAILKGLPAYETGGSVLKRAFKVLSQYPR